MIITAIFGFLMPFIPQLLGLITARMDNKQELAMMKLRMKHESNIHAYRMEEVGARADIAEATLLHAPAPSYGVKLLDAAKDSGWPVWMLAVPFYMFVLLDWVSGMVRPTITYAAFAFYVAYKWARYDIMSSMAKDMTWADQVARIWDTNDFNILVLVLSFWFGNRVAKYAFNQQKR